MVDVAPPTPRAAPPGGYSAELRHVRPELAQRYESALDGARAAVLARLLGALDREPLPALVDRRRSASPGSNRVRFTTGRVVEFPAAGSVPFADAPPGLAA